MISFEGMKNVTAGLCLGLMVAAAPAAAFADEAEPQVVNRSAGAVSGADRLGGPTITAPPHAWKATGQDPRQLSITDIQKEHPRNPHVVGPPVPRHATLPPAPPPKPQVQPQSEDDAPQTVQPSEQPATDK